MMFDETEYREVFSQIKASDGLTRRVLNMKSEKKQRGKILARAALIGAVLTIMAVTVSASETVQNWFLQYFASFNREGLTQEQVEFLEENSQTIHDSQTHNGWTVELHSAIRDESMAYIIFRIEGPENVDLSEWTDEHGNLHGQLLFGNSGILPHMRDWEEFFDFKENVEHGGWGYTIMDDGDGKAHTVNIVFQLQPRTMFDDKDPFGEDTVYHFRFRDMVWYWRDTKYEQELLREKYTGQEVYQYTDEEYEKIHRWETLAEGIWEFEISFGQLKFVEGEFLETYQ